MENVPNATHVSFVIVLFPITVGIFQILSNETFVASEERELRPAISPKMILILIISSSTVTHNDIVLSSFFVLSK